MDESRQGQELDESRELHVTALTDFAQVSPGNMYVCCHLVAPLVKGEAVAVPWRDVIWCLGAIPYLESWFVQRDTVPVDSEV